MTEDYARISAATVRLLALGSESDRWRYRRDRERGSAIIFLVCTVINLSFLAWDIVRRDPVAAIAVEAGLSALCLAFGVRAWTYWRRAREQYDRAHASYMLALRNEE